MRIAFDLVLRRKGITAEALASQRSAILIGRYPAVESKLRELSELKQRIAEGAWASPGTQDWAAQQQRLEDLRSQAERREMEVAQEVADTDIATILQAINTDALANALPAMQSSSNLHNAIPLTSDFDQHRRNLRAAPHTTSPSSFLPNNLKNSRCSISARRGPLISASPNSEAS